LISGITSETLVSSAITPTRPFLISTSATVVDARTQQKYIVNDKFDNPYVKILEIA
jgi:hypothetical protein